MFHNNLFESYLHVFAVKSLRYHMIRYLFTITYFNKQVFSDEGYENILNIPQEQFRILEMHQTIKISIIIFKSTARRRFSSGDYAISRKRGAGIATKSSCT